VTALGKSPFDDASGAEFLSWFAEQGFYPQSSFGLHLKLQHKSEEVDLTTGPDIWTGLTSANFVGGVGFAMPVAVQVGIVEDITGPDGFTVTGTDASGYGTSATAIDDGNYGGSNILQTGTPIKLTQNQFTANYKTNNRVGIIAVSGSNAGFTAGKVRVDLWYFGV